MPNPRIRLSYSRDKKTPANIFSDHDWFRQHQEELLAEYGECVIVIYKEIVLGTGDTYEAAVQNAADNLPPEPLEITPIVELLGNRHPFFHVRPEPVQARAQTDISPAPTPKVQAAFEESWHQHEAAYRYLADTQE